MANVVRFSDYEPKFRNPSKPEHPAPVIILPAVRVERHPEKPKRKSKG